MAPRSDVRSESVRRSVCIDMKLTVQTFLTLDGVMQAPGGPQEDPSESFTHGGWQAPFPDPAVGEFVTELNSHASAFLLGRRTFDIFRGYWPDQTDPANPIAAAINSLPKYVVSHSLSQADATWRGEHPDTARLVTGDVVAAVQALKDEPGDELQIWGSSKLLQTLLQHELVDRFRLMTFPLVLGSGRRLFNDGILPATMRPAGLTVTDLGIVIGTYEPAGPVRHGQDVTGRGWPCQAVTSRLAITAAMTGAPGRGQSASGHAHGPRERLRLRHPGTRHGLGSLADGDVTGHQGRGGGPFPRPGVIRGNGSDTFEVGAQCSVGQGRRHFSVCVCRSAGQP